jgi:hypothetical protein
MKKQIKYLLLLIWILAGMPTLAQSRLGEKLDALQQRKIAFFTENLQLTPAESARFWPVYNDYQNRRDKITNDRNNLLRYYELNKSNMTDGEAGDLINKYISFQEEDTKLLETYTKKFQEFLPAKKVMRIFIVELEFKKWLLNNLRQNRQTVSPRN